MAALALVGLVLGAATIVAAVALLARWSMAGSPATQERRYRALVRAHVGQIVAGIGIALLLAAIVWRVRRGL